MADTPHILERRASLLAGRMTARRDVLRDTLAPPGQRRPFTEQLSKADALAFWRQHRYDATGQQAMAGWQPQDVLELDLALSQANEAELFGGGL